MCIHLIQKTQKRWQRVRLEMPILARFAQEQRFCHSAAKLCVGVLLGVFPACRSAR